MPSLEARIERQYRLSAAGMLLSVSTGVVKTRTGFGQRIVARPGSIVASPIPGAYDPDPDYFFHWYRDSALIVDAMRLLCADQTLAAQVHGHFADFVRFSLDLGQLDGHSLVAAPGWRGCVQTTFTQYLRPDSELVSLHGDAIAADTRVNPDGTLDISRWGRPQHDGPALRALAVLGWLRHVPLDPDTAAAATTLLRADLDWVLAHGRAACIDIWEEEYGLHYYTQRVAAAALRTGADWLQSPALAEPAPSRPPPSAGRDDLAEAYRTEACAILQVLDDYWLDAEGYYRSRVLDAGARSTRELDIAVVLAAVHTCAHEGGSGAAAEHGPAERHGVCDPRLHATLSRLEALFDHCYPINRNRPAGRGIAMGRYQGDHYYSGGAYYFATLGAAEFCYRAAAQSGSPFKVSIAEAGSTRIGGATLIARGDAFLRTALAYTPANGELSEQFDQHTGEQTSARQLGWSHAAFLTCAQARHLAIAAGPPPMDHPL